MSEVSKKLYGFILVNEESRIQRAYSSASYEQTLDGKLTAVRNNWTYVPLDLVTIVEELSRADIYEPDGTKFKVKMEG